MPKEVTLEDLNAEFDAVIARAISSLDKFKANLEKDPEHAFEWGTDALEAAATLRVVQEAKHYLNLPVDFDKNLQDMRRYFTDAAMSAAACVPASTSSLSNLVENYRRSALIKLVNTLNGSCFNGI